MTESLEIRNYRCFHGLRMSSLERVNLVAGVNNVGKTALLEAIYLLAAPNLPWPPPMNFLRGFDKLPTSVDVATRWSWLFRGRAFNEPIEMAWRTSSNESRSLKIHWEVPQATSVQFGQGSAGSPAPGSPGFLLWDFSSSSQGELRVAVTMGGFTRTEGAVTFIPIGLVSGTKDRGLEEEATSFSELSIAKKSQEVVRALRVIEPRLADLKLLYLSGVPMVCGEIGVERPVPLSQMGEGVGRILSIVLEITRANGGIVLIDEIEHGLHHSALTEVWKVIAEEARRADTQIFATTHSWECIQAAHAAFEQSPSYDLRLYRLERVNGEIKAVQYDKETLGTSVEMNLEVR
jgi:hypothetical protein